MVDDQYFNLFNEIYSSKDEDELTQVINKYPDIFDVGNWKPLGDNRSNYAVVKNQQSNPIAALIEKITNSIDALLTKKCLESGIDPTSTLAPKSMEKAIDSFYPNNDWDLPYFRSKQAEEIQIIADGKGPRNKVNYPTSVIVYDNGEGQHPKDFENTFLSLLRGNKNKVHFVQGKYNMGGSGSIVFCGKNRYQLVASKKYTNDGNFGFTLIREHPKIKSDQVKETWFEYLFIDGQIPSFPIECLDLGLEKREFKTGTIIKMYSYQFPKGYSGFAQDLAQSINEFLFSPALPILTKDTSQRYPNNEVLRTDLFGLKRRLSKEETEYLEGKFSEDINDDKFGKAKVSCFVFNTRIKSYDLKRTKEIIRNRYFKNSMSVIFSLNGQVHGHYTSEFITRSLKLNLLKDHLLIHVDCTDMEYKFRKELFMASRDRLKIGEETQYLRNSLAKQLGKKDGRLVEIAKRRKQAINIDTTNTTVDVLKNISNRLPLNSEILKLVDQSLKLDLKGKDVRQKSKPNPSKKTINKVPFNPKRYPSIFKLNSNNEKEVELIKIPLNGEKILRFSTDVEDDYFDRIEEPGELKITILNRNENDVQTNNNLGGIKTAPELFNIVKSSPNKGSIKISLNPKKDLKVGDEVHIKTSLTSPTGDIDQILLVKIAKANKRKEKVSEKTDHEKTLGLPQLIFVYNDPKHGSNQKNDVSWKEVEEATSLEVDYKTVMVPETEGDNLKNIFVNMDSSVLKNFKGHYKNPNQNQLTVINRQYYTSVYFHTLFLYTISKNRGFNIQQKTKEKEEPNDVDLGQYLKDIFDNYYASLILNFAGTEEILQEISD